VLGWGGSIGNFKSHLSIPTHTLPIQAIGIAVYVLLLLFVSYRLLTSSGNEPPGPDPHLQMTKDLSPLFGGVEINYGYFEEMSRRQKTDVRRSLLVSLIYNVAALAFSLWYEWVIYGAYVYMKLRKVEHDQHQMDVRATGMPVAVGGGVRYHTPYHPTYSQARSVHGYSGGEPPPPGYHPVHAIHSSGGMGGMKEQEAYGLKEGAGAEYADDE